MFTERTETVNKKVKELYDWCASNKNEATPRVAVVCPGPPGVGKTTAIIEQLMLRKSGHLFEPGHNQAKEKRAQIRETARLHNIKWADLKDKHIQGLARQCSYLKQDDWAKIAWSFGQVACTDCPKRQKCPSQVQHWTKKDITVGVHPMANWGQSEGLLVIDEMPEPIHTKSYSWEEIARIGRRGWPTKLEDWRRGMHDAWNDWITMLQIFAASAKDLKPWGVTYSLINLFQKGTSERRALDECIDYLANTPMPAPDSGAVRSGQLQYSDWIPNDLETLLRTIRWESDGVTMEDRINQGMPYTACIRAYGDYEGDFIRFQIEYRKTWTPPSKNHMVLDSSAYYSKDIYSCLYSRLGYDFKIFEDKVALDAKSIELYHYPTFGFSRSRSLNGTNLKEDGVKSRIRGLQELIYNVNRLRKAGTQTIVGLIDHKAVLESYGFDFSKESVLSNFSLDRVDSAKDPELEYYVTKLMENCQLVVGYHGGVIGSNEFSACSLLAIMGDPLGHIGMQQEEARTLNYDAEKYVTWKHQTAAYQEVFRARLLDATPNNRKTVLYFGRKAPIIEDLAWRVRHWPEGGRVTSKVTFNMECAIWAHMSFASKAFFGSLMPEFSMIHATSINYSLSALRVAKESTLDSSPKTRESYRRAAVSVAEKMNYQGFTVPHPHGARRPITVFAETLKDAIDLCNNIKNKVSDASILTKQVIDSRVPGASNQRADDDVIIEKVTDIRQNVESIKRELNNFKLMAKMRSTKNAPLPPVMYNTVILDYKNLIKAALVDWKKLRPYYLGKRRLGKYLPPVLTKSPFVPYSSTPTPVITVKESCLVQ